jgi:uncharacterized SAM-binding protein YcdF (DUF218 family)
LPAQAPVVSTSEPIDAVIVLGAPPLGPGVPGPAIERRVAQGVAVFMNRDAAYLVLSGGLVGPPPAEAEIMRALAVARGVPEARILVEDQAKNTFENALYTGLIIRQRCWRRVVVVTDAFHMPRALYVYRRLGLKVRGDAVRVRAPGSLFTRLRLYVREALAFVRCAWLFLIGRHKPFVAAVWGE